MGLLSLAIWLPIASGILLFALGRDEHARAVRWAALVFSCLLYTSPSPRDRTRSRMPSSA